MLEKVIKIHVLTFCIMPLLGCEEGFRSSTSESKQSSSSSTVDDNNQEASTTTTTTSTTISTSTTLPPGGAPNVVFHSDWSTAKGSSDAALRDLDKEKPWSFKWDAGSLFVVDANGLDFPADMENVLRADALPGGFGGGGQVQIRESDGYFNVPSINESLYFRYYTRIGVPDTHTADQTTHGTHDDELCCSSNNVSITFITRTDGTFDMEFSFVYSTNGENAHWYTSNGHFSKHQTYRMEYAIHRKGSNIFQYQVKVYDKDNNIVADDSDFRNIGWGASPVRTLEQYNNDGDTLTFHSSRGINALLDWRHGLNGIGMTPGHPGFPVVWHGGAAICTNTWCGEYPITGVEK